MLIEFELQGSRALHKGIFDTSGFWVKYEPCYEEGHVKQDDEGKVCSTPNGYKIYSHFSFAFYSDKKEEAELVYSKLIAVLRGASNVDIDNIGYFRKLNK